MRTLSVSRTTRLVAVLLAMFLGFGVVFAGPVQAADEVNTTEKLNADQLKRLGDLSHSGALPPPEDRHHLGLQLAEITRDGIRTPALALRATVERHRSRFYGRLCATSKNEPGAVGRADPTGALTGPFQAT